MPTELGELRFVKVDDIVVDPEKNPRGEISKEDIVELVASIRENGLNDPPTCAEGADGLELVAGYRRVAACKEAEVAEIPVYVRDPERREIYALSENLPGLRQNMTPIAEARAMQRIASAQNLNQKQLAKRLGKSPKFVAERLRMLRLPQSVQEVLACGRPGVSAVGPLEKIAKASEEAAARVAQIAAEDEESERLLRGNPERLLARLEQVLVAERGTVMVDGGAEVPRPPAEGELVVIDIGSYAGVDVRGLAVSDERRAALVKRIEALYGGPEFGRQPSEVDLDDSDIDALRALGVLLEYEDEDKLYYAAARYCFDSAAILDRIEGVLSEAEKNAAAQREADAREAGEQAGAGGGEPGDADSAEALAEKAKERRAKELAEEREAKAQARRLNLDLGVRLIKRRSRKRTDKRRRELVRALALMTVAAERYLGGLGPRLTYEAWREVERKRLKSGKLGAEKVTYLEPEEARERLRKDILAAKSIDDVLDVIGDALVGAVYCSEEELPKSRRVCGYAGRLSHASHGPVRKAIDEEAKGVLPPELVEELKRSRERGYEDLAFVG